METDISVNLKDYAENFDKLQGAAYRDIIVNGNKIRFFGINLMDVPSEWLVRKHRHSFFELHYVAEGESYTTIGNKEYKIMPGEFYLLSHGVYHSHRQAENTGHVGFTLGWEFLDEHKNISDFSISSDFGKLRTIFQNADFEPVKDDGSLIAELRSFIMSGNGRFYVSRIQLAFINLLFCIAEFYMEEPKQNIVQTNNLFFESRTIEAAMNFIEDNIHQDVNVEEIAFSVHVSYSHLARLFKNHMGETITSYLNKRRVQLAQSLLVGSRKSLTQIASEVGFRNVNYFCSVFKKICNITPGKYRESKGSFIK